MSSRQRTFLFALIMCVSASFLLTFAATTLRPIQERNALVDRQKNVLKVLGLLDEEKKYSADELLNLYSSKVKNAWVNEMGKITYTQTDDGHPLFLAIDNGQLEAYAMPVEGPGLWSVLHGYFAIQGDGKTVKGITFYEHGETPGLGGEAEKPWFQNNFIGKSIVNESGQFVSIGIVKGKVEDKISSAKQENYVDGISGATVTTKGIETFLKDDLEKYEAFSKRLRRGDRI